MVFSVVFISIYLLSHEEAACFLTKNNSFFLLLLSEFLQFIFIISFLNDVLLLTFVVL